MKTTRFITAILATFLLLSCNNVKQKDKETLEKDKQITLSSFKNKGHKLVYEQGRGYRDLHYMSGLQALGPFYISRILVTLTRLRAVSNAVLNQS